MNSSNPSEMRSMPLVSYLMPDMSRSWVRNAVLLALGSALLTISAKIQVPMWPVPMTMQSFVVLLLGLGYGSRLATATVFIYLAEGAIGLPVFAGTPERGIGLAYMLGPTGGFLVGFLLAAAILGWLSELGWGRSLLSAVAAASIGTVLLFAPGLVWLAGSVGWDRAFAGGVEPFIIGSFVKGALVTALLPILWSSVHRNVKR